jgi:hypothetical protein
MSPVTDFPPPPIAHGEVPQTLVEYIGQNEGDATWRGQKSRVEYRFSCQPGSRFRWVHAGDEEHFRLLTQDFRVRDDYWIDPVADRERARQAEVDTLKQQVAGLTAALATKHQKFTRLRGRPPTSVDQLAEDLHLKDHCGWSHSQIAERRGLEGSNPAGAMEARLRRARKMGLSRPEDTCRPCAAALCLPPPEHPTKIRV